MDMICEVCDGLMQVTTKEGRPMMLLSGDVETGNKRVAVCLFCGNRRILKD